MSLHIYRSIDAPKREGLSWDEKWEGPDKGIIASWERGREKAMEDIELAECARRGELPILVWKGGVEKKIKSKKYGALQYLANWQGLRGESLDIYMDKEVEIVCAKTGMLVTFTGDRNKYAEK